MATTLSRRSFLKGVAAGAASIAAMGVVGSAPKASAEAAESAQIPFASPQQAATTLLNPQKCEIFRWDDAPDMGSSILFKPWQFGALTIENRLVKSAAGSAYLPTETKENIIAEYSNWARGGVKLVWIEDFINLYPAFPAHYKVYDRETGYLAELTEAIHAEGSYCGYQLSLMGASFSGFDASTAAEFECARADQMNLDEVKLLEESFIDAAKYLKSQGVDCVEINAAGNNIGQAFLSRNRNARTDEYGPQSFENRTRFLCEIIQGIKKECGEDFPVQILINAVEENDKEIGQNNKLTTVEENCQIAKMLEAVILIFNGALQPVLGIQIHHDAALVKALVAVLEIGLYDEGKVCLFCLHLQYRRIVIPKMIIGPLPEIRMGHGRDGNLVFTDLKLFRLADPLKFPDIHFDIAPFLIRPGSLHTAGPSDIIPHNLSNNSQNHQISQTFSGFPSR